MFTPASLTGATRFGGGGLPYSLGGLSSTQGSLVRTRVLAAVQQMLSQRPRSSCPPSNSHLKNSRLRNLDLSRLSLVLKSSQKC